MEICIPDNFLLTEKEAASALSISEDELRRLVTLGLIPHSFVVGNSVRVRRSAVLELLAEKQDLKKS